MWLLIYSLLGLSVIFVASVKVIDKVHTAQIELNDYNTLLKCTKCGKFHRKYQEELEIRLNNKYSSYHTCPRCMQPSVIYSDEQYKWLDSNAEFPKLNVKDLRKLKKALNNIELLTLEDRSIEQFLYYHKLLPKIDENDK